jgi:hypothetical protein
MRIEYLFAVSITIADQAARKKGWRPSGRAAWLKADGTMVCFICFEEQLEIVGAGQTVHVVGNPPAQLLRPLKRCAVIAIAA